MKMPSYIQKIYASLLTQYFRYILIAVSVLIAAVGYLVLIQPQFENVKDVGILALKNETDRLNDRQAYLQRMTAMVEKYRAAASGQTVRAENMLPTGIDNAALFRTMQAIASQSGMMLQSVALNKTAGSTGTGTAAGDATQGTDVLSKISETLSSTGSVIRASTVSVSLAGDGSYETFKRVLTTIEQSVRLFDLSTINYSSLSSGPQLVGKTEQAQALTNYSFELKTYYLEPISAQAK
ncbi:MAG: hypothetical protein V1907_02015 [Candidatus Kerfeldbacteria bacterium]